MAVPLTPTVHGPITPITPRVKVSGVLQNATVTLRVGGSDVGQNTARVPGDLWVPITTQLTIGQLVSAVQTLSGVPSVESKYPVPVVAPSNPLPSPVFGSPLSQCMAWIWLDGLEPGATVVVRQGGVTIAKAKADAVAQWVPVDPTVPLSANQPLAAVQEADINGTMVKSPEVTSTNLLAINREQTLPPPAVAQPAIACQTFLDLSGVVPTSEVLISNEGQSVIYPAIAEAFHASDAPPLRGGKLVAKQVFARCNLSSAESVFKVDPDGVPDRPEIVTRLCTDVDKVTIRKLWPGGTLTLFQVSTGPNGTAKTAIGSAGIGRSEQTFELPPGLPTVDPSGTPYQLVASQARCDGPSADSSPVGYQPPGGPFLPPKIVDPLYDCARRIKLIGAHRDSEVQILRVAGGGVFIPRSDRIQVTTPDFPIRLWSPLVAGEVILARQTGCNADGDSPVTPEVQPLPNPLPGPKLVVPIRPSAVTVTVFGCLPGATIHLFINEVRRVAIDTLEAITPVPVPLLLPDMRPLVEGDTVQVLQSLCDKISGPAQDPIPVRKGNMKVAVSPNEVVRGSTTKVTVTATDADTNEKVTNASVLFNGVRVGTTFAPFDFSPPLGAANPTGLVTEPVSHNDAPFSITLKDPPPKPKGKLFLNVDPPNDLILNTLRIIQVDWVVTPLWATATSFSVSGMNVFVTLPDAPPAPNNVVSINLRVTCRLAGWVGDFYFPDQTFPATVTPLLTELNWSNRDIGAGWLATWSSVNDQQNALIIVQVQYMGAN